MSTYPSMTLRAEIRESVSLDEDDLSDVEDEVFIRDGKHSYRFEDMSVKKPLMAPRSANKKFSTGSKLNRFATRPSFRTVCRLCCYGFLALGVLIGLIALVVVLVSIFPLPLDRLKQWIVLKSNESHKLVHRIVPCNDLKMTDVWTRTFPNLATDTPIQLVDINRDGVNDVILTLDTDDQFSSAVPADFFCEVFLNGAVPPCTAGVMALDGLTGEVLWRHFRASAAYGLVCSIDVNQDNITDCLVMGKDGLLVLNAQNGSTIWKFDDSNGSLNVYLANFIPDQDNDTVDDVLALHTFQTDESKVTNLLILSGRNGSSIGQRTQLENDVESYYVPQLFLHKQTNDYYVLVGSGSLNKPGNLTLIPLKQIVSTNYTMGNFSDEKIQKRVLYKDAHKGLLSSAILVDITGDQQDDIIVSTYNSTLLALDGHNFTQLWNFSVPNSECLNSPTPAFFNDDNVTDFMLKLHVGSGYPTYYFSQTFVIDGKTGRPIVIVNDTASTSQGDGLTLSFESLGHDFFLYWSVICKDYGDDGSSSDAFEFLPGSTVRQQIKADLCKLRFNSSSVARLYALNQFDQPPGVIVYDSESRLVSEYPKSPVEQLKEFLVLHPERRFETKQKDYDDYDEQTKSSRDPNRQYKHKDNGKGLLEDFTPNEGTYYESNGSWEPSPKISRYPPEDLDADYELSGDASSNNYRDFKNGRDPRSQLATDATTQLSNTSDGGIYGYVNVKRSRSRLLHDLTSLPSDILRDLYFKNLESDLKKSRFEQRDLKSHRDRIRLNEEIKREIEREKQKSHNMSETLWDLESEKEVEDREDGYPNWRTKRKASHRGKLLPHVTSTAALSAGFNSSTNSIHLILAVYWTVPKDNVQVLLPRDFACIDAKLAQQKSNVSDRTNLRNVYLKKCLHERGAHLHPLKKAANLEEPSKIPYYAQLRQVSSGSLTVYRIRLECVCKFVKSDEKCAKIARDQRWDSYLGSQQKGAF